MRRQIFMADQRREVKRPMVLASGVHRVGLRASRVNDSIQGSIARACSAGRNRRFPQPGPSPWVYRRVGTDRAGQVRCKQLVVTRASTNVAAGARGVASPVCRIQGGGRQYVGAVRLPTDGRCRGHAGRLAAPVGAILWPGRQVPRQAVSLSRSWYGW